MVRAEIDSVRARAAASCSVPSSARARRRVDQLHRAGLIAKDDELHLLLIADGLDPSGDGHRAVGETLKLLDEYAFTHERPVYVARMPRLRRVDRVTRRTHCPIKSSKRVGIS